MAGQQWALSEDGGYLSHTQLSRKVRNANQPRYIFRQFTRVEPGIGKNKGDTIDFRKVTNIQTGGGRIGENQDIPESKVLIKSDSLVITEWGNSIPFTGKLEALAEFDPENIVQKALMNDQHKTLDVAVADEFQTCNIKYIPTADTTGTWDTDGTPNTTATVNFNMSHLKNIVDNMMTGFGDASLSLNPVPTFPDGNYVAVLSVKAARGLYDDPEFQEAAKFAIPRKLLNGELPDVVYNTRILTTNNIAALSNGLGSNDVLGEALVFGDDAVMEGVAIKEELRAKVPVKYGRDKGIAWYAILDFQKTWDLDIDSEDHIVHVTSDS